MAYLGHKPAVGENNSFRILDDISSFVLTFDGSSASAVGLSDETITITENNHRFITGQRVTYSNGGGGNITGLTNGQAYFVINHSKTQIKLASSASNALAGTAVNLTGLGTGSSHTLTLAFDGVNTKFVPTFGDGMHDTLIKRAAQLVISLNGVIQQPHDTATPSTGFGVDSLGNLIFSTAPASTDIFWAHVLATNTVTFDSSDNDVDTFTGNGSTTSFTLSKVPPDNRNILVTIDGVVQYPSDAANTRSYNVSENVMTFVAAPGLGAVIQVRHIGYAGPAAGGGGGVTGFYGRTGNVSLQSTDNIVANNATFSGNVSIAQTLTYEDVTDIDAVGLITARSGINVSGGTLTVANDTDLNGNLDVAGISTLRGNVTIAGITTFSNVVTKFKANNGGNTHLQILSTGSGEAGIFFDAANGDISGSDYAFIGQQNNLDLVIKANPNAGNIDFQRGTNTKVRIDTSGKVGIGTVTPSKALHVDGTIFASGTTTSLDGGLRIQPNNDGTNYGGVIYGGAHNDNNTAIYMRRGQDTTLNTIDINSYGTFRVFTGGALASQTEKLRITSAGKIGINTASPRAVLDIEGNAENATLFLHSNDLNANLAFSDNTGGARILNYGGDLAFRTGGNAHVFGTGDSERVRITSDGFVGIGVTNPEDYDSAAKNLVVGSAGQEGITIRSSSPNTGNLQFSDGINKIAGITFKHDSTASNRYFSFLIHNGSNYVEQLRLQDGKLIFSNDQDSYINGGGDVFRFYTGGNERLRIGSNGEILTSGVTSEPLYPHYVTARKVQMEVKGALDVGQTRHHGSFAVNCTNSNSSIHLVRSDNTQTDGTHVGVLGWVGYDGSDFHQAAAIEVVKGAGAGSNDQPGHMIFKTNSGTTSATERLRIKSDGELVINHTQSSTPLNNTFLSIYDANSDSSAIDASGISKNYAMISLHNYGTGNNGDTTGIGFGAGSAFSYTKGSIAFTRSGSYGTGDLVFLTNNDQNTTMVNDTDEKLRITRDSKVIFSDCDVSIGRDTALANYADGSTTRTQLAVVKDGGGAGSGYHEVAHFTGGSDSNDTGAIVRITQFNNDRGMFIKAGRGTSDQAKAIIGLRNSAANEDNWLTLIQNTDQINIHKNVDFDNGVNLSLGGLSNTHAPLHVKSENTSYGKNAIFGANGWVNNANYHQSDANVTLLGRDLDGNDKGAGIEFCVRNTGDSNWNHGAITFGQDGFLRMFTGGAGTYVSQERLTIDNQGNSKLGTSTPTAFTGSAPNHTQRFLGKKCMQGSVTSVTTLAANGTGTFELGRLWLTDDSSTELFIQVMRNDSTTYQTHYCKAFIQKVRGTGMSQGHILYQNGAASGYSVTSITSGGYTVGSSAHGTRITVSGGAGGVIYRMVCFYTTLSKNDMY